MVGMAIVGVAIISLYAALTSAFNVARFSREDLRATQILIDKMELMRLYSWEQITDSKFFPKTFTDYFDPVGATNGSGGGTVYKGKMSVKKGPQDVDYEEDVKTVTVELSWQTANISRHREFQTYVTKNGLQSYLTY